MERRYLLSTYLVTSTGDDPNPNSLRWAILQANADRTPAVIEFAIPGQGPQAIRLASPLPPIAQPVVIDAARSQPGYQGSPLIAIDGSGLGAGTDGLVLSAGSSTVRGLALIGFTGSALVLRAGGGNLIEGNYLGVIPSGTAAIPNGQGITILGSSQNTIGSGAGGAGNVISGNLGNGILIQPGSGPATDNLINGNRIGTTADGTRALGNRGSGIAVEGSPGNLIGAAGQGLGNLVSGNLGPGIRLAAGSGSTQILNNTIGLAGDSRTPLGNGGDGIWLRDAPSSQIGGVQPSEGNIIACNGGNGIATSGDTTGLVVMGNAIGTDPSGVPNLGNLRSGIELASSSNTVGGTTAGAANLIEYNGTGQVGAGVQLVGNVHHNLILSNSIYGNAGLGINLGGGPTPNHAPGTPGPNDYQNYPVLAQAQATQLVTSIQGSLVDRPNTSFLLQFFASPTADPSGHGQGKLLIGSTNVQTDDAGNATFQVPFSASTTPGQFLSATATGPGGNTSEFSVNVMVEGQVDLKLTATATPNPVPAGGLLTYTLVATNQGSIPAHGVMLTDQIPTSTTLVSTTVSQGFVVPTMPGRSVTANLGTISSGASATVTIVVRTSAGSVGTIINTASVSSQEPDPTREDNTAAVTTTVQAATDLSISLRAGPSPALVGGELTYTITVTNRGPAPAGDVIATLPISPGAAFVSAGSSVGTVTAGSWVKAELGALGVGASATVTVVLRALVVGDLTETAVVSGDVLDSDPSNNVAGVTTPVIAAADLSVGIAASTRPAATGQAFDYILTVTNNGPLDATGVVVSDTLPEGVDFVQASTDQGVIPTRADRLVTATFDTLAVGASARLTIAVIPTAAPGSTLHTEAIVAGQQADPNPDDDTATLDLPVRGVSDLGVAATVDLPTLVVGQPLTYTISVTNDGPADEPDAVLTGVLPNGVTIDSSAARPHGGPVLAFSQGILTADLGMLAAHQAATVTLVVIPGPGATGALSAEFSIGGRNLDPVSSNDTAEATVAVAAAADLSVAIAAAASPAIAGLTWTYTLVVSNGGPTHATGVTAVSPLPPGFEFVSAASSQGSTPSEQGGDISADLGTIAAGQTATVTVVVRPTSSAAAAGAVGLSASVIGNEFDPALGNNRASLKVAVAPSVRLEVRLEVSLSAAPQAVQSGQMLTITATVVNTGSVPATDVVLALPPVAGLICDSWTASQGTTAMVAGSLFAHLGALAPGSSAHLTILDLAVIPGSLIQAVTVTAAQYNLDPQGGRASATAQVEESPGMVQFGSQTVTVGERDGVAVLPVVRLYGARGTISIAYQTIAIDATPGRDFVPTAGTLVLGPGQTAGTISVPILANPYDNHDETLNLVLHDPAGGAVLGTVSTALLRIHDVDPDFTPPRATGLSWTGSSQWITSLSLSFTEPLDPRFASNPASYHLVSLAGGGSIPIASVRYDPLTWSVTVVPASPLPSGRYAQIQVAGSGPAAIRDLAGNLLDGNGTGTPGSNYGATFAQGARLKYVDNAGNRVVLRLKGPGYLQQVLSPSGEGLVLNLVGMVPRRTTLSGSVKHPRKGGGSTELGVIQGLGQFGDVRVRLKTPPFQVQQFPFQRRGRAGP